MSTTAVDHCLSVVMPCFNEEHTLEEIARTVLKSPFVAELIIVDDGSHDRSVEIARSLGDERVAVIEHDVNMGKGAALRTGFVAAVSPFVIVQDADLEYDPDEYGAMLAPLFDGRADVVFGSRFSGGAAHRVLYFWHSLGNKFLTTLSNMMTNLNLTDMETCYKVFRREVIQQISIEENRFGVEPELTAKIARLRVPVYEVGIGYSGRTYEEGKKIGWRDGVQAIFCIVAYSPIGERIRMKRLSPVLSIALGRKA